LNTNKEAIRILCFGDSNTWGYIPGSGKRYDSQTRWTCILQKELGNKFEIIEEGLNSRTTDIDDNQKPFINGSRYLVPCIRTHNPFDGVVLFLGTNDLKSRYKRNPNKIAESIGKLIVDLKEYSLRDGECQIEIILICPPIVDETVVSVKEEYSGAFEKSKKLPILYKKITEKNSIHIIDLQKYVVPSKKDGYHLDKSAHKRVSQLFKSVILGIKW
jgi:lysophospholipase L1-like esterase